MGRQYVRRLDQPRAFFTCGQCNAAITDAANITSTHFHGKHGKAFLTDDQHAIMNIKIGPPEQRLLLTGVHIVRDAHCAACGTELGWAYDFAKDAKQRYKIGKFVLERALVNHMVQLPMTEVPKLTAGGPGTERVEGHYDETSAAEYRSLLEPSGGGGDDSD